MGLPVADAMQVSVDQNFARFGLKTFAINKINSVEVRARRPFGSGPMVGWGCVAIIALATTGDGLGAVGYLIALGAGYFAYRAWAKTKVVEYQLFLMTSSSEAQAFASNDGKLIGNLRDRIESAMAGQLSI